MRPPLRVLHLNSMLRGGGTDDQCVKLAAGLLQLGQSVWIAGPDGREFSRIIREQKIPFEATGNEGPVKLAFILRGARLVRRHRIQIVHGHHGRDFWPTILVARISGTRPRVVLTRHLAKSPASWASRRFLLGQCDALVAVSNFVSKVLREGASEPDSAEPERRFRPPMRGDHSKIHVIPNGIELDRFRSFDASALRRRWSLAPEHYVFAVVGGYDKPRGKGQREFLAAAARLHGEFPQARFLIIGRGDLAEVLQADIERLGLTGRAWLTPFCTEMPAAMNAIDCLVHPQIGTEAGPVVTLEAMACGKPIIASQLDGIPEQMREGEHGWLVPPEDIAALAKAMRILVADPALGRRFGLAAQELVCDNFTLQVSCERVLALYRRLSGRSVDTASK